MKKKIVIGIVLVLVIAAIAVFGGQKDNNPDTIKIGMIGPFAGSYAVVGETFQNGALLAVEEIGAKNPGKKIELIVEDGAFDPAKSLSAYKKLTGIDKVDAIIAVDTVSTDAIYKDALTSGIPVIHGGEQSMTPVADNFMQINPGNYDSEVALGAEVKKDNKQKVVLVTGNHEVFFRFAKGFKEGYGSPVEEHIVNFTEQDIRTFALKIKASNPDAVAFIITPDLMARFTKTFNELGMTNVSYYYDADLQFGWDSAIQIVPAEIFNGHTVVTIGNYTDLDFVSRYEKRFGNKNVLTGNVGYDAVQLLVANYNEDNSKWVSKILKSKYEGVSGKISFNDFGIRIPEFKIGTIEGGKLPN